MIVAGNDFIPKTCKIRGCKQPTYEFTTVVRRERCKEHAQVGEWKKRPDRIRYEGNGIRHLAPGE